MSDPYLIRESKYDPKLHKRIDSTIDDWLVVRDKPKSLLTTLEAFAYDPSNGMTEQIAFGPHDAFKIFSEFFDSKRDQIRQVIIGYEETAAVDLIHSILFCEEP